MPRGGRRQGTPGRGYANRSDLALDPNMGKNTAASGGMEAPVSQAETAPAGNPFAPAMRTPDDSPSLTAPTMRPGEPITAGMPMGAGPGPEALTGFDPRAQEIQKLKRWVPILTPIVEQPDTPIAVKTLYRYIRGF